MINNGSGTGAHTSLMINASQRVIFDPAGTVRHARLPEKDDVLFGVTPAIEDFYVRAHARKTHHVVIQTLEVPPDVAELALQKVLRMVRSTRRNAVFGRRKFWRRCPGLTICRLFGFRTS